MKKFLIIALMIFCGNAFAQQLPFYSQYMYNQFIINPAVAGSKDHYPALLSFRNQWVGNIEDAPTTQTFTMHGPWKKKVGLGGSLFNDMTGPVRRTGLQLAYAYHLQLPNEAQLGMGIAGGVYQFYIDKTKLTLDQPNDLALQGAGETTIIPDAVAGIYYYHKNYYAGFSVPQLIPFTIFGSNENDNNMNKLVQHYFLTGGYKFEINDDYTVQPSVMLKAIMNAPFQFDINTEVIYRDLISLGLSYRHKNAAVAMLGVRYDKYRFGYAYDLTLTSIKKYTTGSHEIYLGMDIPQKKRGYGRFGG